MGCVLEFTKKSDGGSETRHAAADTKVTPVASAAIVTPAPDGTAVAFWMGCHNAC